MARTDPSQRLYSLDALRGFDMFWIIGGEEIFHSLAKITGSPFWKAIAEQFTHPDWNGFHLYDLIFPLFLFMAGVATPFSVGRQLEKGVAKSDLVLRVAKRALILVLLGIIKNNGLGIHPLSEERIASVLGRIGLAYMFANIIYIYTKRQTTRWIWFGGILLGYWAMFLLFAAPGFHLGDLTMQGNIASYIDLCILPGKLYLGIHDPEGLASLIPAVATGLLGIMAGTLLKEGTMSGAAKCVRLAIAGVIALVLAQVWNLAFPINKNLWTSSFVLQAGGMSLLLLSLFYYIIDVRGIKKWAFFFTVIGMNSILIYMSSRVINWEYATHGLFQWAGDLAGEIWKDFVLVLCMLALKWAFLYFMYRKKVFLRV